MFIFIGNLEEQQGDVLDRNKNFLSLIGNQIVLLCYKWINSEVHDTRIETVQYICTVQVTWLDKTALKVCTCRDKVRITLIANLISEPWEALIN